MPVPPPGTFSFQATLTNMSDVQLTQTINQLSNAAAQSYSAFRPATNSPMGTVFSGTFMVLDCNGQPLLSFSLSLQQPSNPSSGPRPQMRASHPLQESVTDHLEQLLLRPFRMTMLPYTNSSSITSRTFRKPSPLQLLLPRLLEHTSHPVHLYQHGLKPYKQPILRDCGPE